MINAFDIFLKIYLVVSTLFFWPGVMAYGPQETFIQYSAIVFFGLSLFVPKRRETSNVYLALFLFYALVNMLIWHFEPRPRLQFLNLFLGVVTIKIISERADTNLKKIGLLMVFLCLLNIGWMAMQYFNQDPLFNPINPEKKATVELVGLMNGKFAAGVFAALVAPMMAYAHPALALLAIPILAVTRTSTCAIAYIFSINFYFWMRVISIKNPNLKKRLVWMMAGISAVLLIAGLAYVLFYDGPSGQFMKRVKIWQFGFHYTATGGLKNGLWFGLGLGGWGSSGFQMLQENGQPEWWSWAHNDWLQYLCEQGIVGTVFLYCYLKNLSQKIKLKTKEAQAAMACFAALAICSFFHFPFHVGRLAGISIYILGLMEAHTSEVKNEENLFRSSLNPFAMAAENRERMAVGNGNGSRQRSSGDRPDFT